MNLQKVILLVFLFLISSSLSANDSLFIEQIVTDKKGSAPPTYNTQSKIPSSSRVAQYPGGFEALIKYLEKNVKYPEEARINGEQGQVVVQFWVEETGEIKDVTILKGISPSLDKETIRLIYSMPKWIPAEKAGDGIKMMHILFVNFDSNKVRFSVGENKIINKK